MVAAVTGFPARPRLRPHGGPAASRRYERRRPEKTPLHKIISENLESWLEWREAAERSVPGYVEDELRGYLACGLLCFGFARARCTGCGQGFVVAFSCKGRGVCPSCNGRHMAQTAAHLADHVIPPGPVRQWVISVPKRLRGFLADRPPAVAALTKIFLDEIERLLCGAAGGASDPATPASACPRLGGISFLHRFGSALNHHVHVHACVTDGVFVPAADQAGSDALPAFLPARPITQADLAALTGRVRRRVIRWFRMQRLLDAAAAADMLAWENSGFSVDASVRITLIDRDVPSYFRSLEHLLRYCARPPFALERLFVIRGRGPTASSNSRHLSFSIVWRTLSRRRESTGTAITGCLPRITSSGGPSRRWRSGTSASGATPRRAGMGVTVTTRKAAATRLKRPQSPARTTPHGSPGRSSWPGWGRSFRWSAEVAGAGHHLPRCDRIRRGQDRQGPRNQKPSQCWRPARAHGVEIARAFARAVQG